MPTLKRYVIEQCADPAFRRLYEEFCEVCAVTVELVARLHRLGLAPGEAAAKFGLTVRELDEFIDAEYCSPAVVEKICAGLGIAPPADCRKKGGQKKPPGGDVREV